MDAIGKKKEGGNYIHNRFGELVDTSGPFVTSLLVPRCLEVFFLTFGRQFTTRGLGFIVGFKVKFDNLSGDDVRVHACGACAFGPTVVLDRLTLSG